MKDLQEKLISEHFVMETPAKESDIMQQHRENAIKNFEAKGFPTTQLEDWKYTNLKSILNADLKLSSKDQDITLEYKQIKPYLIHDIDSYQLVFINGVYSSYFSSTTHGEADVCVMSSASCQTKYHSVIEQYYNKVAKSEDRMVSLNTAYTKDGAYIHIPDNVVLSKPIQILNFVTDSEKLISQPRNLVVVGKHAEVKIIERHQSLNENENVTNAVTEIYVDKNSHVDFYKIQNDAENASLIDSTYIHQERDSTASVHTFSFGGKFIRNGLNFFQNGENCNSILKGVTIGEKEQLIDHHTFVEHMSPNCESHELYRTILGDSAKGVFNGKILVDADAQKIDAFQQNNNILLSNNSTIDTKPQLEIFADDVKCSHGCTVGQLDDEAMFYLQSRGIPHREARALLLFAFSADVLDTIDIEPIKKRIIKIIAEKLEVDLDF